MADPHRASGSGPPPPGHYQPQHLTLTQADQDIIKSFLSSVPAGFPLSPGAALAELSSFSPLSPSLPSSGYHFSLSPARPPDPPSPRHRTLQSPKRPPAPQRSSLAGFHSPRPSSSQQSPQRLGPSRTHSPDLSLSISRPRSPGDYSQLRRETFTPAGAAWSPQRQSDSPTFRLRPVPGPAFLSSPSHLSSAPGLFEDSVTDLCYKRPGEPGHADTRRPRHSHSPGHSPPPRQSMDYSPLMPVGSFSPRRSYFNPPIPNPYSPVNPPAPYSPRRPVSVPYSPPRHSDHRYYDPAHCPSPSQLTHPPSPAHLSTLGHSSPLRAHSPSQLTHPPSPSRNLDLSPGVTSSVYGQDQENNDSVAEPLDLDTHTSSEQVSKQVPQKTSKPLTASVKQRLGLTKSKSSKAKNKKSLVASQSGSDRKALPKSEAAPPSSTTLETNLSEVSKRLEGGCGCELECLSDLDAEFVWRHRCNIAELSKGEHDMYLMGIMMASLANPRATSKHKERQRNRNKYIFQGKEICQEAFLYLENVTIYQLKSIRKHVIDNGVVPRVHRNTGKKPHNVLELDHYQLCHRFVEDLLEKERGGNRKKTFLADLTCKKLHSSYLKYFADLGMDNKTMAYSTFRHFVHQRFPQLKFTSREAILGPVTSGAPGDPGVSINVSASDRHDTVLSIQTETHQQFD